MTDRIDEDDPVILLLDPESLQYLPESDVHLPRHVAVMTGYDDETVQLSDGATEERQGVSRSTFRTAWINDRFVSMANEYLVVTRAQITEEETDAAAAGLRHAVRYMLDPLAVKRDARGPGEEGLPALRSFADYVGSWPDLPDPWSPVASARRSIDEHGDGSAFRGLYAESVEVLGRRTGIPHTIGDRLSAVGREWGTVEDRLDTILGSDEPAPATFEEAASLLGAVADREAAIFEGIAEELGGTEQ